MTQSPMRRIHARGLKRKRMAADRPLDPKAVNASGLLKNQDSLREKKAKQSGGLGKASGRQRRNGPLT
jgi:hypothetical protein